MSYNIDSVKVVAIDAWMTAAAITQLYRAHENEMPECNFLYELQNMATRSLAEGTPARIPLGPRFYWSGEWSGHSLDLLKNEIAPHIHGRVEVIFTWEGGDSFSGLIIDDGKVIECSVEMRLVPQEAKP